MSAAKSYLVRGIDPIPPNWEFASGWRALTGLRRSITTLGRLIDAASAAGNTALARDLRRVRTTACQAQSHISGGFPTKEIGPLAKKVTEMQEQLKAERPRKPRLVVMNSTRGRP